MHHDEPFDAVRDGHSMRFQVFEAAILPNIYGFSRTLLKLYFLLFNTVLTEHWMRTKAFGAGAVRTSCRVSYNIPLRGLLIFDISHAQRDHRPLVSAF